MIAGGTARAQDVLLLSLSRLEGSLELTAAAASYAAALAVDTGEIAAPVVLDSPACESAYGVRVVNAWDWEEIRGVLDQVRAASGAHAFLILGGPDAFPQPLVLIDDPAPAVYVSSDAWYLDFDGDGIVDEGCAIGRLPEMARSSEAVIAGLCSARDLHLAGGLGLASEVHFTIDELTTPPYGVCGACTQRSAFFELVSTRDVVLFAGHGNSSGFYTDSGLPIFTITYMDSLDLQARHPLIYGYYSCYTGQLPASARSLGSEFTRAGAGVFLARTTTLGVPTHVAQNLPAALANDEPIGTALFRLMRETVLIWGEGFKGSSAHLVLYGDPTLRRRDLTAAPGGAPVAARPRLESVAPNPLNARAEFAFLLPEAGPARLAVYDLKGRLVRVLFEGEAEGGRRRVVWDGLTWQGRPAASGLYVARLIGRGGSDLRRFVVLR